MNKCFMPAAVVGSSLQLAASAKTMRAASHFKDIVQPKKRGVRRGTIRFVLTSYTVADVGETLNTASLAVMTRGVLLLI